MTEKVTSNNPMYCDKSLKHLHEPEYLYTYLIDWQTGYVVNIYECINCGAKGQSSTMFDPKALHGITFIFRKDTRHIN